MGEYKAAMVQWKISYVKHNFDSPPTNFVGDFLEFRIGPGESTKARINQLFSMADKEFPDPFVGTGGDLHEFGKTVSHLAFRKGLQHVKVKESHERSMIGSKSVLEISMVDADYRVN